jgi:hypothetical protein
MAKWSVLVWNMSLGSPLPGRLTEDERAARNWRQLDKFGRGVKVVLLNEAVVRPGTKVVYGTGGTQGRDGGVKPRAWSTAIISPYGPKMIVDARPINYLGQPRRRLPLENSRPGSWTAAEIQIPEVGTLACVSIYGLLDDLSDDSVHRSLSEISPIFSDKRFRGKVILGGDPNLSTQLAKKRDDNLFKRVQSVFDRIEGYGLSDCLALKRVAGRLDHCTCPLREDCTHTRTKWVGEKGGPPHQMDYLFASRDLVGGNGLVRCKALEPELWKDFSDHAPILATFRK